MTSAMMSEELSTTWDWIFFIPKVTLASDDCVTSASDDQIVDAMNRALDKTFEDNDKLIEYIKNHNINVTVITFTIHFGWLGRKLDFSRFSFQSRIMSGTQMIDSLRTENSRPGLIGMSPPGKRNNIQLMITILHPIITENTD